MHTNTQRGEKKKRRTPPLESFRIARCYVFFFPPSGKKLALPALSKEDNNSDKRMNTPAFYNRAVYRNR